MWGGHPRPNAPRTTDISRPRRVPDRHPPPRPPPPPNVVQRSPLSHDLRPHTIGGLKGRQKPLCSLRLRFVDRRRVAAARRLLDPHDACTVFVLPSWISCTFRVRARTHAHARTRVHDENRKKRKQMQSKRLENGPARAHAHTHTRRHVESRENKNKSTTEARAPIHTHRHRNTHLMQEHGTEAHDSRCEPTLHQNGTRCALKPSSRSNRQRA